MNRELTSSADFHSHLVPGVDDGARDLDGVLASVGRMAELGIRRIITTPHLDGSLTLDPAELEERLSFMDEAFERAAEAVGARFPDVEFRRGHEVMLDVPDVSFLEPRIRLAGTSFILVEWPRIHLPPGTAQVLQRIASQGFRPIVAHPERYIGLDADLAILGRWRDAGAYLQVNYGSLEGRYGSDARTTAFRLLRRGWADYLASDFHGHPERRIYFTEARDRLARLGGQEAFYYLTRTNPGRIFDDEPPLPVPALPAEQGFWAKVKDLLSPEAG